MKNKIIILSGDPNSINSELIYKSWCKINKSLKKKIYLISNYNLLKKQFKKLNYKLKIEKVKNLHQITTGYNLKVIDVNLEFDNAFDVKKTVASQYVINSLKNAHLLALKNDVLGIINCPIDKKLLANKNIGVTEYFASRCGLKDNSEVMLIKGRNFSVSPMTTHININDVPKKLKKEIILKKVKTINNWFKKKYKKKPKIGILGLNPHNSEFKKNSEERKIIIPAILNLKKRGFNIEGPLVADTVFINNYKNFDVILGMYHDQVLAPFKALFKFDAINVTLGLKYLRCSPDHGPAINIIGKKKANPKSLINCINFINKFGK